MAKEKFCHKTWLEKRLAAKISLKILPPAILPENIKPQDALAILRLAAKTSGNAANKVRKNLAAAWSWGIRYHGLPELNPFRQCERFPADEHPRRVPSLEEFWQVYNEADEADKTFLLFLLHTGARVSEVFRLEWEDIDFSNRRVRLGTRKTGGAGMHYAWLPLTEDLAQSLSRHKRANPFGKLVFRRKTDGGQYKVRQHLMENLCRRANVKQFGFHGIRHLSATALAYAGLDLPTIQAMLRHSSPATTARYIKSLGLEHEKIEAAFRKAASIHQFEPAKKAFGT